MFLAPDMLMSGIFKFLAEQRMKHMRHPECLSRIRTIGCIRRPFPKERSKGFSEPSATSSFFRNWTSPPSMR